MPHAALIDCFRSGFASGATAITREGEPGLDVGLDFSIHVHASGQPLVERHAKESIWVLLDGEAELRVDGTTYAVARHSLFDEGPTALHLGPDTPIEVEPHGARVEWAVARVTSGTRFGPRLFRPQDTTLEARGRGLAQGACLRTVRTVLDRDERPGSGLVVGEVVNLPGRWSSYPPHSHLQPELYHYRFTLLQGYGHAELGDEVLKVQSYDTLKIMGRQTHAQVAAPGYGMWYLWIVRHLQDAPYTGFEYEPVHRWMLDAHQQGWEPHS